MNPRPWTVRMLECAGRKPYLDALRGFGDPSVRTAIVKRVDRLEDGNFGDHRDVGGGVWELRIHQGPGYRVYYALDAGRVVVLLHAGAKVSQDRDVSRSRKLWKAVRPR